MKEISYDGFLGKDMPDYIKKIRERNHDWFEYLTKLNRFGEKYLTETNATTTYGDLASPEFFALLITARSLSNLQGTILMAERGMLVEARTLARSILENSFMIAALNKEGQEFVEKVRLAQQDHNIKLGKKLSNQDLDKEVAEKMKAFLEENKDEPKAYLSVAKMVELGDSQDNHIWYSQLSNDAAHPSFGSITMYIDGLKDGTAHINTLPVINIDETLLIAAVGIIEVIRFAISITKSENFSKDFEKLGEEYLVLEIKSRPGNECINPLLSGIRNAPKPDQFTELT